MKHSPVTPRKVKPTCPVSWWVGKDRDQFDAAVHDREQAFAAVPAGWPCDGPGYQSLRDLWSLDLGRPA